MSDRIQLPNGDTVVVNQGRRQTLYLKDLYKYKLPNSTQVVKSGDIVAQVDDRVWDYDLGEFRVIYRDQTTYEVELAEVREREDDSPVTDHDRFLATNSGYQSEAWRCYLDTRTLPHRLEISEGFRIYGNRTAYIRLFRGFDTTETGEIVSAWYNQAGEYVSDRIPVSIVANVKDTMFSPTQQLENIAIKAPDNGFTTKDLAQGEDVTLVAYTQDDVVVRTARLNVHHTNLIRRVDDTQRRVSSIQLVSPFLSESDATELRIPLNVDIASLVMEAKVNYADGTSRLMTVGDETSGKKFMLYNLMYWSPTNAGTPTKVTLVYRLDPTEEYSRATGETVDGFVSKTYTIVPTDIVPKMSLKLYVYPTWSEQLNSYTLHYYLYDLERLRYFEVPASSVELVESSRSFDGSDYQTVQTLHLAVKLKDLDPSYGEYRHTQAVQIALIRSGGLPATNWRVRHNANQSEWYGDNMEAVLKVSAGQTHTVNVAAGQTDTDAWIDAIYYAQDPLRDPQAETKAPRPTHFYIDGGSREFDFPIDMWANDLTIISDLREGQNLGIRFVHRSVNGELQLAAAGMPAHYR